MYSAYKLSNQFSSVTQSCPTLCDPMNHSTPGFPVHHQPPELTKIHIQWLKDANQPFHPLSSPSPQPPIPPSIRVFSNESTLHMRWPKYWSFNFSIIASKEIPHLLQNGLVGSLCSPRDSQESSPTPQFKSINFRCSAFFTVQLSHPYMSTGKTIALTRWTFVDKVMSLLLNMLSRLVINFLPRSKRLLILWLQLPSAVILEPPKIKSDTVSPSIFHEVMGSDAMIFIFWMLSFKPTFSLSTFTFIKRLFISSSLSAIRVVSSAYLRYWHFSRQSWFQLVFLPVQHFSWCTLHIS